MSKTHQTSECRKAWRSLLAENERLADALTKASQSLKRIENRIASGKLSEAGDMAREAFDAANMALSVEGKDPVIANPFYQA